MERSEFISKMFKKHFSAVLGNEPMILYWGWGGDLVHGQSQYQGWLVRAEATGLKFEANLSSTECPKSAWVIL